MGPSVQIHDGDAVAKERDTPSPFFVTCVDHKVKSTTMNLRILSNARSDVASTSATP